MLCGYLLVVGQSRTSKSFLFRFSFDSIIRIIDSSSSRLSRECMRASIIVDEECAACRLRTSFSRVNRNVYRYRLCLSFALNHFVHALTHTHSFTHTHTHTVPRTTGDVTTVRKDEIPKRPFLLEEIYLHLFYSFGFNGTWVSDTEIMIADRISGDITVYDVLTGRSKLIFDGWRLPVSLRPRELFARNLTRFFIRRSVPSGRVILFHRDLRVNCHYGFQPYNLLSNNLSLNDSLLNRFFSLQLMCFDNLVIEGKLR